MMLTVSLERVSRDDISLVGGKAMGCARMHSFGCPVPRGFVVTTAAFEEFIAASGLRSELDTLHALYNGNADDAVAESHCSSLAERVRTSPLPAQLRDEIAGRLERLRGRIAVRSSATVEDAEDVAFAGIFHSEVHVSPESIGDAVRVCWAHSLSFPVIQQILRNNLNPARTGIALLVQEMVPADFSGVLFTDDPTEARPGCAIVSMTKGTGEHLLSGDSSGDLVAIDRSKRTVMHGSIPDGVTAGTIASLVKRGIALEREFGLPLDIEWALIGSEVTFLQARPITTIENRHTRTIHWTRELTEERYPKPISPLGWSILQNVLMENLKTLSRRFGLIARHPEEVAKTIRHYVYSNKTYFSVPGSLRPSPLKQMIIVPRLLFRLPAVLVLAIPSMISRNGFGLKWLLLSSFFKAFMFPHARDIHRQWGPHLESTLREMDAFNSEEYERYSLEELLDAHRRIDEVACRYMEPDLAIYIVKIACSWIIERMGKVLRGDKYLTFLTDITSGIGDNRTLHMNVEIEEMSDYLSSNVDIASLLMDERYGEAHAAIRSRNPKLMERFIAENGHVTTNWDVMESTWGEDPVKIMQMLRAYLVSGSRHSFTRNRDERQRRYEETRNDTVGRLRGTPWMISFFLDVQSYLREFMSIDEEHHFYCSRLFAPLRRLIGEMGKRLAGMGIIDDPDDVFFLTLDEMRAAVRETSHFTRRQVIRARRSSFRRSGASRPPDNYVNQTPVAAEPGTGEIGSSWRGVGASSGIATGAARVVNSTEQARAFREGEILVTTAPNPLWTSLYAIAAGMVASTGSILSHGLVSAREYHLPAVIGIPNVTEKITDGQRITIDGDTGTVSLAQQ